MIRPSAECNEKKNTRFMNRERELIQYMDHDIQDEKIIDSIKYLRRRTSLIVCMTSIKTLTAIDAYKMLDVGLKIARFRLSSWADRDRLRLLRKLDEACKIACEKYQTHVWPLALDIELKTCTVKTGSLENGKQRISIEPTKFLVLTNNIQYKECCNADVIYLDNTYLTQECKVGLEINIINAREITLECVEILDEMSVRCKVLNGGVLTNACIVAIRGIKILRPVLSPVDEELLNFAFNHKVDIVTITYVRRLESIDAVKKFFRDKEAQIPLIFASICTEECLQNIDDILKASDGVIIARSILINELTRPKHLRIMQIQKWITAKCLQAGKPVYLSGGIFQEGLRRGDFNYSEVSDVANAVIDGVSGFQLKGYDNWDLTVLTMRLMDDICRTVEPYKRNHSIFWRMVQEISTPINAAQASAMACVALARITQANAIVVPTITGKSVEKLMYFQPPSLLLVCCLNIDISRRLRFYPNTVLFVCPAELVKNKKPPEIKETMINAAIEYAVQRSFLVYGDFYITFQRGHETTSYQDTIKIWKTVIHRKNALECPDTPEYAKMKDLRDPTY